MDRRPFVVVAEDVDFRLWYMPEEDRDVALVLDRRRLALWVRFSLS